MQLAMAYAAIANGGTVVEPRLVLRVEAPGGRVIEWDPKAMKAKNCPEAEPYIRRKYREGWTLQG